MYAGWYERPDGIVHPCAINLGRRPTFYEHADHSLLEAHLLDFSDDLYGERAEVRFAEFLRSERKFDGVDALVTQLKHDIEHTRRSPRRLSARRPSTRHPARVRSSPRTARVASDRVRDAALGTSPRPSGP